jgi:ketosteroid isomerase-like protein
LKNALDIGSRPQGKNIWDGKPAGVVSVTPYKMGAFGANHHVRQALVYLNMPAMQQPEAYIGGAADLFDDDGNLANEETRRFLKRFMAAFEQWVTTLLGARPGPDFPDLMKQRERIAAAYCNGDSGPLDAIVTETGTTTFLPPLGGVVTGAKEVKARYDKDVDAFSPGAKSSLEVINSGTSRQLVFWTGIQDFQGEIYGQATTMKLRITEVFRLIEGEWKLVHRHADPAVDVPTRSNKT